MDSLKFVFLNVAVFLRAYKELKEDVSMSLVGVFSRGNILLLQDHEPLVLAAESSEDDPRHDRAHGSNKTVTFDLPLPNNEVENGSAKDCCSGCKRIPVPGQYGDGRGHSLVADHTFGSVDALDGPEEFLEGGSRRVRDEVRRGELDNREKDSVPSHPTFVSNHVHATDTSASATTTTSGSPTAEGTTAVAAVLEAATGERMDGTNHAASVPVSDPTVADTTTTADQSGIMGNAGPRGHSTSRMRAPIQPEVKELPRVHGAMSAMPPEDLAGVGSSGEACGTGKAPTSTWWSGAAYCPLSHQEHAKVLDCLLASSGRDELGLLMRKSCWETEQGSLHFSRGLSTRDADKVRSDLAETKRQKASGTKTASHADSSRLGVGRGRVRDALMGRWLRPPPAGTADSGEQCRHGKPLVR